MTRFARNAVVIVALATVARILLAAFVPLFPDETYYWDWSRNLAAGYFDHPPAIAILIRAGTALFGATPLGVRIGAIVLGAVASLAIVATAARLALAGETTVSVGTAEFRAALLMTLVPAALVGFVMATPDAPLLACVALTVASLERAVAYPPRSRASFGWWCAAGVTLGAAFASKYTSVLVPFAVLIALVWRRDLRAYLASPGPYVAGLIAIALLAPVLVWNAHHGWVSFAFQLHHGLGEPRGSVFTRELNLFGSQLGLISPIIAVLAAVAVIRALGREPDGRRALLGTIAAVVFLFFVVSAVRKPVEANWPIPALAGAFPLLATWRRDDRGDGWLTAGFALAGVCTLVLAVHAATGILPLRPRRDPISRAHGWNDLATAVQRIATDSSRSCSAMWIAADRYQEASELAFHLPGRPRVFALNLGGRPNQYDLWPSIYSVARPTDCALIVLDDTPAELTVLRKLGAASSVRVAIASMSSRGQTIGTRAIWLVRGIPAAPPRQAELSPSERASLTDAEHAFGSRSTALDSIVRIYRRGPAPTTITADTVSSLVNADRKPVIEGRIASLHRLIRSSAVKAVYRDERYPECTFIRVSASTHPEIGYVDAPRGCAITPAAVASLMVVERVGGDWMAYAVP